MRRDIGVPGDSNVEDKVEEKQRQEGKDRQEGGEEGGKEKLLVWEEVGCYRRAGKENNRRNDAGGKNGASRCHCDHLTSFDKDENGDLCSYF